MTAEAPSYTARKISDTSALVGTGESVILASICVTTRNGFPAAMHLSSMTFCAFGSSHNGMSLPRSPLAMTIISASGMISSRSEMPSLLSILAKIRMSSSPYACSTSRTSLSCFPFVTNGCITAVTPYFSASRRFFRSSSVSTGP